MSYIITSETELSKIAAPNLPLATREYSPIYIDQLNNVFRLYFNRLDNLISQLNATGIIPPTINYTVATLPSAATSGAGARSFVTDALGPAFGATVVGAGTVKVPVYSDGVDWKVG